MHTFIRSGLTGLVLLATSAAALAQEVTVMISGGFKAALEKLAPEYEAKSGDRIVLIPDHPWERHLRRSPTGWRAVKKQTW